MARKKPDAIVALDNYLRPDPEAEARNLAARNDRARQYLAEQGLTRQPDESTDAWTARLRKWMRDKVTFRRFHEAD